MESGRGAGPPTHCLICQNVVECVREEGEGLLEQQLRVVYVVSKLFEIPQHFTTRLLAEYGNPGDWTTFCAQCHSLVTQGEEIFREIQQLEKKHQKVKDMMKLAMQVKPELADLDSCVEVGGAATEIREYLETLEAVVFAEDDEESLIIPAQLSPSSSVYVNPTEESPPVPEETTRRSQRLRISNVNKYNHSSDDEASDVDVAYSPPSTHDDVDEQSDSDEDFQFRSIKEEHTSAPKRQGPYVTNPTYLTFQEVLQVHNDFTGKLHPPSKTASKQDKSQRIRDLKKYAVSKLVKANKIKDFPCQTCPNVFSEYKDWYRHTQVEGCDQNPVKTFKQRKNPRPKDQWKFTTCDRAGCSTVCLRACGLRDHIKTVHLRKEEGAPTYPCLMCGKVYKVKKQFLRHKKLHDPGDDPYLCSICGKTFKLPEYLKMHSKTHNDNDKTKKRKS